MRYIDPVRPAAQYRVREPPGRDHRGECDAPLETAFGDLLRDADRRAVARLDDAADGRAVQLRVDEAFRYLMVYTADNVADLQRRRRAVALEPMTCPPEALRTETDLIELDEGDVWQGSWGLQPGPAQQRGS